MVYLIFFDETIMSMGELTLVLYNGEHKTANLDDVFICDGDKEELYAFDMTFFFRVDRKDVKEIHIRDVEMGELSGMSIMTLNEVDVLTLNNVIGLKRLTIAGTSIKEVHIPDPDSIELIQCNWFTKITNFDEIDKELTELSFE